MDSNLDDSSGEVDALEKTKITNALEELSFCLVEPFKKLRIRQAMDPLLSFASLEGNQHRLHMKVLCSFIHSPRSRKIFINRFVSLCLLYPSDLLMKWIDIHCPLPDTSKCFLWNKNETKFKERLTKDPCEILWEDPQQDPDDFVVAIVDSGVVSNHPWPNSVLLYDPNQTPDETGSGTAMLGIVQQICPNFRKLIVKCNESTLLGLVRLMEKISKEYKVFAFATSIAPVGKMGPLEEKIFIEYIQRMSHNNFFFPNGHSSLHEPWPDSLFWCPNVFIIGSCNSKTLKKSPFNLDGKFIPEDGEYIVTFGSSSTKMKHVDLLNGKNLISVSGCGIAVAVATGKYLHNTDSLRKQISSMFKISN